MPRPKPPPTPLGSIVIAPADYKDMTGSFELPSPAVASRTSKPTPPASPEDPSATTTRYKRTLSGGFKSKEHESLYDLPPPPSRTRKIIQMKPKSLPTVSPSSGTATANAQDKTTKRKQPSATSAAGRKIARKTAHSIIERRRRSKMNEEFGVLKDMIPACKGLEMHKLAILQAGIEYVKYLEKCVTQLKGDKGILPAAPMRISSNRDDSMDEDSDEDMEDPESLSTKPATSSSTDARARQDPTTNISCKVLTQATRRQHGPSVFTDSPSSRPIHSTSATPTPTLLSPAFNAIHFSPELNRIRTNSTTATSSGMNMSPSLSPLPQASVPLGRDLNIPPMSPSEDGAEATAAALLMLTTDRRSTINSNDVKYKSISVRDLLSS